MGDATVLFKEVEGWVGWLATRMVLVFIQNIV